MGYQALTFPENSTFLVTGAAGFIGSNLCEAILAKGCKVKALDDLSTGKQENVDMFKDNPNYTFIKGDILYNLDLKALDECMQIYNDVVDPFKITLHIKNNYKGNGDNPIK